MLLLLGAAAGSDLGSQKKVPRIWDRRMNRIQKYDRAARFRNYTTEAEYSYIIQLQALDAKSCSADFN